MDKENNSPKLSNNGFGEFIKEFKIADVSLFRSSIDGKLKFKLDDSTRKVRVITNYDSITEYANKLYKVVSGNRIEDTDKVFFSKGSKFPRTSFNRYSNKARRIENVNKANKIVLSNSANFGYRMYTNGYIISDKYMVDKSTIENLYKDLGIEFLDTVSDDCPIKKKVYYDIENKTQYGYNWSQVTSMNEALVTNFKNQFECENAKYTKLDGSITDMDTFDVLSKGYPLTSFVTDINANKYIDQFKDIIDDDNYDMLLAAIKGEDTQVSLAMKLIENMNCNDSKPYLYSLFINGYTTNRDSIINNKYYRSVGMKNLLETYNLQELKDITNYYGYNKSKTILDYIEKTFVHKLKTNEEKQVLLKLIDDVIKELLKDILGKDFFKFMIKNKLTCMN